MLIEKHGDYFYLVHSTNAFYKYFHIMFHTLKEAFNQGANLKDSWKSDPIQQDTDLCHKFTNNKYNCSLRFVRFKNGEFWCIRDVVTKRYFNVKYRTESMAKALQEELFKIVQEEAIKKENNPVMTIGFCKREEVQEFNCYDSSRV